ncbi:MAG: glutamine-hydrolyzing carbamoyl-phosphate synthase small subunit [Eubacteriales bacterium]
MKAIIYLEDGTKIIGKSFGAHKTVVGELVFNTGMTGYQEVLTDPSYSEQVVVMTYPIIGNYGTNLEDSESKRVQVKAFVVREYSEVPSHYLCHDTLDHFLKKNDIPGIYDLDTRMLTKKIRDKGSMKCLITTEELDHPQGIIEAYQFPKNVVSKVSRERKISFPGNDIHVGIVDLGLKEGIAKNLIKSGCTVTIYPSHVTKEQIMDDKLDVLLLSNGPGDPKDNENMIQLSKDLQGEIPLWGICLGHQILALSLGADTYKLKFGHRGSNHPVMNLETGKIMISSQNHGYAVKEDTFTEEMVKTYININDNTIEGFDSPKYYIKAVQFHPEEGPGPIDGHQIFQNWLQSIKDGDSNA